MKKSFACIAAVVAVFLSSCTSDEGAKIKKVIFPGDYPDPSILRDGEDFYMTHSSFTYYPGLLVWHSTDLVNWEPVSRAVGDQSYSIYAPEICKVGDKYYIYYPTSRGDNFVVTADSPAGPWSEPVKIDVNGIDPGHVTDENGQQYLYTNNGFVIALTEDGLSAAGANKKVYDGWQYPQEWETEGMWLESPKLFKHGEYYYLVTAEGGTAGPATSHMVVVARSKSVVGPWENSPYNPLVHTYSAEEKWWSKGHGTIFDDAEGNWYIVYHSYRNSYHTLGRNTLIESISWSKDGWPVLPDGDNDQFDEIGQGDAPQWANIRDFHNPLLWARWEPGFIEGADLWTVTAVDTSYEVTAEFELQENAKAGMYLFYNEDANIGIMKENIGGSCPKLYLRIKNECNVVTTEMSTDGSQWTTVDSGKDVSSFHHNNYKGFFALRPSLLVSDGTEVKAFDYKVL